MEIKRRNSVRGKERVVKGVELKRELKWQVLAGVTHIHSQTDRHAHRQTTKNQIFQ